MSYTKSDFAKTLLFIAGIFAIVALVSIRACAQNGITSDETGITINPIGPILYTIIHEAGERTKQISGDVIAYQYDVKSIPAIYSGQLIRIDSVSIRDDSGLITKQLYITPFFLSPK